MGRGKIKPQNAMTKFSEKLLVIFTLTIIGFVGLVQNRGPITPLHHDKQYNTGFYIESTPDKNRTEYYDFLARYVNPGKQPEPIDVDVEVMTGDGKFNVKLC